MSATEATSATPADGTYLQHHFDDLEQQKESSILGMWAFLATEVMLFGGLFLAYSINRALNPVEFAAGSRHLNVVLGAINTAVLLSSSLTMALAVHAAQVRNRRNIVIYLLATMALGAAFLGVKASEWYTDYREKLAPGINWDWEEAESHRGRQVGGTKPLDGLASSRESAEGQLPPGDEEPSAVPSGKVQIFFLLYFFMTGLHAIHMIVGLTLVGITAYLAWRGWFSGVGETQIEVMGLYWHFVDVVWVFLYPLLYLIDAHK